MAGYDCTRCGACCFNPPENVREGYSEYIEVAAGDELRERPALLRRYAVERLVGDVDALYRELLGSDVSSPTSRR